MSGMNQRYLNSPVREAVCEFRFQADSPWDLATPGLVYAALRSKYPRREPAQRGLAASLAVSAAGVQQEVRTIQIPEELRFWRNSEDGVIKLAPNILSVSHYKEYVSWAQFRADILEALRAYRIVAEPVGLERVGLRYINDFEFVYDQRFAGDSIDLSQFFGIGPEFGDLPISSLTNFVVAIECRFDDDRDSLRIQMQPTPAEASNVLKITLDLDYFLSQSGQITFDEVENWLETAHSRIRNYFEGCIKEELRQSMQSEGG